MTRDMLKIGVSRITPAKLFLRIPIKFYRPNSNLTPWKFGARGQRAANWWRKSWV